MTDTAEETAQALTARQQMEEVWGDRKREKKGEDETMEDGRGRPSETLDDQPLAKYRRDENKGKGQSQASWSGWGQSYKNQEKAHWQKTQEGTASEQPTGMDAPTQELVKCMAKLVIKHEQELMRLLPDLGFVIFADTSDLGCLKMLRWVAESWQEKYEQGTVNIALKTVLAMSLLKHLKEKTEEVLASDQRLQKCLEVGWLVQTENALNPSWVYHT